MSDTVSMLREVPLFSGMEAEDLAKLAKYLYHKHMTKGQVLFQQGDRGDEFLIVTEGSVKVELVNPDGKELTLAILKPYQFLGELALLDDFPRSANAIAMEDGQLLALNKRDFLHVVNQYPRMFSPITRQLTRRVRVLTDDIASMAFLDSFTRTARKLVSLAQDLGVPGTGNAVTIPQALTHQELANLVGATRETVSKVIGDMRSRRLITVEGHKITILNKQQFAEIANLPSFSL
ncbi:Crp/Fnr family transcriptional regulator [bacterium]|nr:Crp/Fnr family transcriptional regulator [bacterium]